MATKRYLAGYLTSALLLALSAAILLTASAALFRRTEIRTSADAPAPVIVIDPGHGGEDGGASGADGTVEKELNLLTAEALAEFLACAGFDVRLTRTDDRMLYDLYGELSDYTGHRKTYDLRSRLRFAEEADAALFVSIHMNKFPQAQYRGLQVYYAAASGSREAADAVQNYARTYLQPENSRQTKRATSSIYLLHRIRIPAMMIECGFLSNEDDLAALKDADYRRALALTIACAIAENFAPAQ